MIRLIDIHTHILPGIDDGAVSVEDTLAMARSASAEGITTIVATPHHANGTYSNIASIVLEHTRFVNERLRAEGIPILVESGQEIRLHDDLLEEWSRK
ncbi:CpsB/CapC family capsule biosynthesis tyrosine phosphatase [Paenibacillus sp. L3-i20]|uniref:CpsB/CapC family capsule biosynthesis tyrosine phosphatase n=1 Tax=Paenibacillus sp. L3-i20 TaxID=2905833 RepID=UPI0020BDD606|nr:CpsB/CapC family capsule biosynthesis tyrosine phosphatase [Paenibacillus sp. L3-i20]